MATQHIEDCIINGGSSLIVPCPDDNLPCENDSTGEATIWNPRNILGLSPDTKLVDERLIAVEDQVLFKMQLFTYAPGTGALEIHKNGLLLTKNIDWVEQTTTSFQLAVGAVAGDQIIATGHVGVVALVDVRDTDIYVSNYQAIRDYVGTETLVYSKGKVLAADGGQDFFIYLTGAGVGFYVDNDNTVLVPTGGDGTIGWVRRGDLNFQALNDLVISPSVKIGDVVRTFGYLTAGDGGANVYEIVAGGTGTADGGYYIDLSGTGFQARGLFGAAPIDYNTRQWGILGDGVTDESVQIQRAIDFLASAGGGTLTFPATTEGSIYRCNITLNDNTSVKGASRVITLIPAIDAAVITVDPIDHINRLTIQLLVIDGAATKLSFTSQDGILVNPGAQVQDKISIVECIVTGCGNRGIVLSSTVVGGQIRDAVIERSTIIGCVNSGLAITGVVRNLIARSSTVNSNGDENIDANSNIVISADGGNLPVDINFDSVRIDNANYLVSGSSIVLLGVRGLIIRNCSFSNFFTALYAKTGPNTQISVSDSRFSRLLVGGDCEALADLLDVNGLSWVNNDVPASLTGPSGIKLSGLSTALLNVDISSNNTWGSLTKAVDNFPASVVTTGAVNLPHRIGMLPITIAAPGVADLNTIYDENGGIKQLVAGDEIILHTVDAAKDVVVKDGVGNIQLDGGVDFTLGTPTNMIKLAWSSYASAWVEISRSTN